MLIEILRWRRLDDIQERRIGERLNECSHVNEVDSMKAVERENEIRKLVT